MCPASLTIGETIEQLHRALRDYIEATYHISHPTLVAQRRRLLDEPGVIYQRPYLESTPRYRLGASFRDLGLDPAVLEMLSLVTSAPEGKSSLIHDPPYQHQAEALVQSLVKGRSLLVMTGTGSGKTECFLLPILGKLSMEARDKAESFQKTSAVRAILLYPMNALVNDQLGRLRLLFGDARVVSKFKEWAGRPARFARYTSRTLYPGVRSAKKDQERLAPIGRYYVHYLEEAADASSGEAEAAQELIDELQSRGKWPAKPDLVAWYGKRGTGWQDKNGDFRRCVTLPDDAELLTRHEVLEAPPDILVTNYSMLEYMMMRPIERPIFERTKEWLHANPDESLLLVVDEAHLYRGAAGAEVGLLLRRLRMRLDVPADRVQVVCTSASFRDPDHAAAFAAQLTGKERKDFETIGGDLLFRDPAVPGGQEAAEALARVDLSAFYDAETSEARLEHARPFLEYCGVQDPRELQRALYEALAEFPPMGHLTNLTMQEACSVDSLAAHIFPGVDPTLSARALTTLVAFGSLARQESTEPGLLPCRAHSFYRGLPGLWVCMDPECDALPPTEKGGPTGRLYSQPRDSCECGARVLELYTCRNCGSAYARAYTGNLEDPEFLWAEPGGAFRTLAGQVEELGPLDLLLETPLRIEEVEPAEYDLVTGRLNPPELGPRTRQVYLRKDRFAGSNRAGDTQTANSRPGEFRPCAVCGEMASFGRSSVQDHQTKGDQPFQALITKQIQVQPPSSKPATRLAPLRGRKVLVFSDSRQTAARLAPNLQKYSTQDTLRPLLVAGYLRLQQYPGIAHLLSLEDLYFAVLLASKQLGVRLRPELKTGESFSEEMEVEQAVANGALDDDVGVLELFAKLRATAPPVSLLRAITVCVSDEYYGLESLALASIVERPAHTAKLEALSGIPGLAESGEEKLALARAWLRCWPRVGFWLSRMPQAWWQTEVRGHSGQFSSLNRFLAKANAQRVFDHEWLPQLRAWFTEQMAPRSYRLKGIELSLSIGGAWGYCHACRTTQRLFPGRLTCVNCCQETVEAIDPDSDAVFSARKGYYRSSTVDALRKPPIAPIALIAAEHTAQLNVAQAHEVFSTAEEHELLFQDVDLGGAIGPYGRAAIDVLSCTTTMEVGIDIGTLSGVSLRNMPPARANYQQRSGRAGRRGNALATVTAFGSADSHDEHYFAHPDQMIRGAVDDPTLTLDNPEITRRHIIAYLLQRYHQTRLPMVKPEEQPQLFAVLGTVANFKSTSSILHREDFAQWLRSNEAKLKSELDAWLPDELSPGDRTALMDSLVDATLEQIDLAIHDDVLKGGSADYTTTKLGASTTAGETEQTTLEVASEEGEEQPGSDPATENLLDRLLYKGVLPRYAFPTDVVTFHVFDRDRSQAYRPAFRFTPSQGLAVALSQYAPGKEVWIKGKLWRSGALYSPGKDERYRAWQTRRLYYECSVCHYARTVSLNEGERGERRDCEACGRSGTFGPARYWLRPPGFAHPVNWDEGSSPDDQPSRSYATRAKLIAPTPADPDRWTKINDRLQVHSMRQHLLVTNSGPRQEGYTYCTTCGLIEPTAAPSSSVLVAHPKPYPDEREPNCDGVQSTRGLVLGTDFISDVLLVSLRVQSPVTLAPGVLATEVALRTLCEALSAAGCAMLELEASELQAEYRPALTPAGPLGKEAEIYLYDTLPGGAGFSHRVGQLGSAVFEKALQILESCPDNCDRSCYRCLRSYKNKFEHDLLDRHLGASILRFLLTGERPMLDPNRLERSSELLFQDFKRQSAEGFTFERNATLSVPGVGDVCVPIIATRKDGTRFAIALHSPLTPDDPPTDALRDLKEYSTALPLLLVDELVVRRNLPRATSSLMDRLG